MAKSSNGGGQTRTVGGKLVHVGPGGETAQSALLSVDGVADLLTCSTRHVRRLADAGAMPRPIKLGSLVRWRRADIDQWLAEGCHRVDRRAR